MNVILRRFIYNNDRKKQETTHGKSWLQYLTDKIQIQKNKNRTNTINTIGDEFYKTKSYTNSHSQLIKEEKTEELKKLLSQFSNNTSLHGVRSIADSQNLFERLFYIIVLGSFMVILAYYSINLYFIYRSHPINKVYSANLNEELLFPGVTMCDVNQIPIKNQTALNIISFGIITKNYSHPLFSMDETSLLTLIFSNENETFLSRFDNVGLNTEDWTLRWLYGNNKVFKCYMFNAMNYTELRTTNRIGLEHGLMIQRDFHGPFYEELPTGVRVFVHSPNKLAHEKDSSFFSGPGMSTYAVIHPLKMNLLGYPFHPKEEDCVSEGKKSEYSQQLCEKNCEVDFVMQICNCSPSFASSNIYKKCSLIETLLCQGRASETFYANKSNLHKCNCIRSCSFISYTISTSAAYFPGKKNETNKKFRIHLFYESLILKEITEQEKYTPEALLGQFGGQMGLFLGASLLTVLEVIELVLRILWTKLHRWFN